MRRPDSRTLLRWGVAAAALFLALNAGVHLYAELAWFRSLGQAERFWTLEVARVVAWVTVFLTATGGTYLLLRWIVGGEAVVQIRRRMGNLEIAEALPEHWVRWVVLATSAAVGLLVASPASATLGERALAALHADPWGAPDPILERDPRFYVFYLPFLRGAWTVLLAWLVWGGLATGTALFLTGRVRLEETSVHLGARARRSLLYLAVTLLLLVAAHFYLSVFDQVSGGPVGYVDVRVELPVRRLLAILALVAAGAVAVSERTDRWRFTLSALAVLGVTWLVGLGVLPEAVQRFRVEPNELELETPYIEAKIQATRTAFDLEGIRVQGMDLRETNPPDLAEMRRWTSSLPVWDERPLEATYNQLQGLLAYHRFPDIDNDRYYRGPRPEQVAVGVREFDPALLTPSARTWQNLHLRYTHGTGTVMSPVDRSTEGGAPAYYIRDIPPAVSEDAPTGLTIREPRVFFGELTSQYIMVPADSLPAGAGTSSVRLDGVVPRLLFAWALGSKNILLRGGDATPRLAWRRSVVPRVRSLVPFLYVDPNPYPVIDEGHVKWIVEIFSISARYPLSERVEHQGRRANYLHSVAKGVVDGASGEVDLYVVRPEDPVLGTYRQIFPRLFRPVEEMPAELRAHLRYPRSIFLTQAELLTLYHMRDPTRFYHRQDMWSVGREVYAERATTVEPYYLVMPFPDTASTGPAAEPGAAVDRPDEFLLTVPFTPRDRDNLAAFLMARNSAARYGDLWLFNQRSQEQVFGPRQIEVQIDQDSEISQQLSLWQQRGSRAIRGHLLLVPMEGFLLYVEPLFLVAEDREGAAPGLARVIAAAGDRVAMARTLDGALRELLAEMGRDVTAPADTAGAVEPAAARALSPDAARTLRRLQDLLERADAALREGDLARFGELWSQIRTVAPDTAGRPAPVLPDTAGEGPG